MQLGVGDKIVSINGIPMDVTTIRKALSGKENTLVVLQVDDP